MPSIMRMLRQLLGYLPENSGGSIQQRSKDHHGFLTIPHNNGNKECIVINLPFNPLDCGVSFEDDDNGRSSCDPGPDDDCEIEKGYFSIRICWKTHRKPRKIHWTAKERVL